MAGDVMAPATLILGYALIAWYAVTHWTGKELRGSVAIAAFTLALTAIICATVMAMGAE